MQPQPVSHAPPPDRSKLWIFWNTMRRPPTGIRDFESFRRSTDPKSSHPLHWYLSLSDDSAMCRTRMNGTDHAMSADVFAVLAMLAVACCFVAVLQYGWHHIPPWKQKNGQQNVPRVGTCQLARNESIEFSTRRICWCRGNPELSFVSP